VNNEKEYENFHECTSMDVQVLNGVHIEQKKKFMQFTMISWFHLQQIVLQDLFKCQQCDVGNLECLPCLQGSILKFDLISKVINFGAYIMTTFQGNKTSIVLHTKEKHAWFMLCVLCFN
jgi:hypothetical protein